QRQHANLPPRQRQYPFTRWFCLCAGRPVQRRFGLARLETQAAASREDQRAISKVSTTRARTSIWPGSTGVGGALSGAPAKAAICRTSGWALPISCSVTEYTGPSFTPRAVAIVC